MRAQLTTKRLVLRAPRRDDAAIYAARIGNPAVARFLDPVPLPYSVEMAREWMKTLPDQPGPENATFVVELPDAGLIGAVGIRNELGYWFAEPHWGKGYATEACTAVIDWFFARSDVDRISSGTHIDNPASANVQRKLGFVVVGHTDKYSEARQCMVPHIVTALTRTAWFGRTPS
ncbi:MAG: GNAT family N-acetyltransferase [Alphaproteobacteria bacterium]|nr:GNAT family N-acetyltransferase [Alphaproteobacteria bacterium]